MWFLWGWVPQSEKRSPKLDPVSVVSPDELNAHLRTLIVAPMTTGGYAYPFRVSCRFRGKVGHVILDQIRTVDRERIGYRYLGGCPGQRGEMYCQFYRRCFAE